jgi:hypothetical protein
MLFSITAIIVIFVEIIIMLLQSKYGGMFFIPKKYRKGYYNYFRSYEEIKKIKVDIESVRIIIKFHSYVVQFVLINSPLIIILLLYQMN